MLDSALSDPLDNPALCLGFCWTLNSHELPDLSQVSAHPVCQNIVLFPASISLLSSLLPSIFATTHYEPLACSSTMLLPDPNPQLLVTDLLACLLTALLFDPYLLICYWTPACSPPQELWWTPVSTPQVSLRHLPGWLLVYPSCWSMVVLQLL